MGVEIERKFLVDLHRLKLPPEGEEISQGFIAASSHTAVRVRLSSKGAWLTLKSAGTGARRLEFEYPVPREDARAMLRQLCAGLVISKTRYLQRDRGHTWEIDVFHGANHGLVMAEVELGSESEVLVVPDWATEEVTGDPRYYNLNLATHPFSQWNEDRRGS